MGTDLRTGDLFLHMHEWVSIFTKHEYFPVLLSASSASPIQLSQKYEELNSNISLCTLLTKHIFPDIH